MYVESKVITISDQSAISFVKRVAQKYPALEQNQLKKCIQAVLTELFNNLSPDTKEQFFTALPEDTRSLVNRPYQNSEPHAAPKKPGRQDKHTFLTKIKVESELYDTTQIKKITYAVLSSLVELLPAEKSMLIRSALPVSIKQIWTEALHEQTLFSLAMQRFQQEILFHFRAANEQQLKAIMHTVVTHLIRRFGEGIDGVIINYLPEEIRFLIGQMEPPSGASKRPIESLSIAELLQIVQQEANLANSEDARQALLGIFRAVKKAVEPVTDFLSIQMADDWGQLWQEA